MAFTEEADAEPFISRHDTSFNKVVLPLFTNLKICGTYVILSQGISTFHAD